MQDIRLLVVDDEHAALRACSLTLRSAGYQHVTVCHDAAKVMELVRKTPFALVLLDLAMPGVSGEELLAILHQEMPSLPVVIMTAFNDAETAMRCIRAGAYDYLTKPLDQDRLVTTVRRTLDAHVLQVQNARLKAQLLGKVAPDEKAFSLIITQDEGMRSIFRYISAIADSSEPVLITGETGVGKDLMARAVHECSGRAGSFVALNAAGLEEEMFSDVLFGHTKGAFTGAAAARGGMLQKAANGTIFLDEIGDVALSLQSRLLRVIETGEYYAGGLDTLLHSDARVVVATNRDVYELCEKGNMRRDLLYRLDVHHIHIPPLRERSADIPLLVRAFLGRLAEERERPVPIVEEDAMDVLASHHWPGNVRELRAVLADAVSRQEEAISAAWLRDKLALTGGRRIPEIHHAEAASAAAIPTLREATEALIQKAMQTAGGNQCRAAKLLGISQPALSRRLKSSE